MDWASASRTISFAHNPYSQTIKAEYMAARGGCRLSVYEEVLTNDASKFFIESKVVKNTPKLR